MATLGEILRKLRKERGMSQEDLGISIGRAQSEIYRWEKGIVRIPAEELPPLALALSIPVEQFFADVPAPVGQGGEAA